MLFNPDDRALFRRVWQLAWPTAIYGALELTVGLVDLLMVRPLGPSATAAIGIGRQVTFLVEVSAMTISIGVITLAIPIRVRNRLLVAAVDYDTVTKIIVETRADELRSKLAYKRQQWDFVTQTWQAMGLIQQSAADKGGRFSLRTRMGDPAFAKCPSCGVVAKATKSKLLQEVSCPKCCTTVLFVLLKKE